MANTLRNGQNIAFQSIIILIEFRDIVYTVDSYSKIVLGKVEGDKDNKERKNWHGHISVDKKSPPFLNRQ